MRIIYTILICCAMTLLTSCDFILPHDIIHMHNDNALEITSMQFSDDYKKITVRIKVTKENSDENLADTSLVDIKVKESYCHVIPILKVQQPKLESIKYIAPEDIKDTGLKVLTIVDLSQPDPVLDAQREYVQKLHSLFSHDNLYLTFMLPDGKISPMMMATDYIVNNYIDADSPLLEGTEHDAPDTPAANTDEQSELPRKHHAWLYRTVSNMLYNVCGHSGTVFDSSPLTALIIFSEGQVYDETNNLPLDPQHFTIQERLINQSANMPSNVSVFYVNLDGGKVNSSVKDNNMMHMLCMRSNGKYLSQFDWLSLRNDILNGFNINNDDYVLELSNKDGKIYFGNMRDLHIRMYKKGTDTMLAECTREFHLGTLNAPIIVGNKSYLTIYLSGLLITLIIIISVFIILQFIMPYVRYRIFRKKYVVSYTGQNMSVQGKLVADTCYFCKAPFQVGDSIVAKCQHTMHEECWYENDQHCPEHGKHCQEGSHFYDAQNIFNPRNGTYLTLWLLFAIIAATVAWFTIALSEHSHFYGFLADICEFIKTSKPDTALSDKDIESVTGIMSISPRMYILPLFGLYFTPLLTIVFASLAGYHRPWQYRVFDVLSRGFAVLVFSLLIFIVEFVSVLICDTYDGEFFFDCLPWAAVTYLILFASTTHTRIHDMHSRTMLCVSLAMGVVNALMWNLVGTFDTKRQITLFLFFFILYAIVLAVTIARRLPVSEKYFLHVNGEVKEMDIALYKWLRQTPDAFVTIGRSVDCQLQISWDTTSDVAPVHAIIRQRAGLPYLSSVDGEVFIGNNAIEDSKPIRLRHGMSFQIGTTVFTFVEV